MPNIQKLNAIKNASSSTSDRKKSIEAYLREEKDAEPLIRDTLQHWLESKNPIADDDIRDFIVVVNETENITAIAKKDLENERLTSKYFGSQYSLDKTLTREEVLQIQLSFSYIKNLKALQARYEQKYQVISIPQSARKDAPGEIDMEFISSISERIKDEATKKAAIEYKNKYLVEKFQNELAIRNIIAKEEKDFAALRKKIEDQYVPDTAAMIPVYQEKLAEIKSQKEANLKQLTSLKSRETKDMPLLEDDYHAITIKFNELIERTTTSTEYKQQFNHIKIHTGEMSAKAKNLLRESLDGYDFNKTLIFSSKQNDIKTYLQSQIAKFQGLQSNHPEELKRFELIKKQIVLLEQANIKLIEKEKDAEEEVAKAQEDLQHLNKNIHDRFTAGDRSLEKMLTVSMEHSGHSAKKVTPATHTSTRPTPDWISNTVTYVQKIGDNINHFTAKKKIADEKHNTKRSERYEKAIASFKGLQKFGLYCCNDKDSKNYQSNKAELLHYAEAAQKDLEESRALKKGGILGLGGMRAKFQKKGEIQNELDEFVKALKK